MEKTESKSLPALPSLPNVISTAIQIPGAKVNRTAFLEEQFDKVSPELAEAIIEVGPVEAGCSREELRKIACRLVQRKTYRSTAASFLAGIPGGFVMAATIPADMLQFYGLSLALAQELSYLYGAEDLWSGDILDEDKVTNQLILYCGVMLGASGASQTIRVLSSSLAKQAMKKIPQKALTKTFYYPIVKSIAKAFGAKMTKEVFAKGVSKAVPIIGGVVSGGLTFVTLRPMGMRLADTLDKAHFDYTEADFEQDWDDIVTINEQEVSDIATVAADAAESVESSHPVLEKIQQAKNMLDSGIINEEEFAKIKDRLIAGYRQESFAHLSYLVMFGDPPPGGGSPNAARFYAPCSSLISASTASKCFMFMYNFAPHMECSMYRKRAQTSISAEFPSGNVPTTRVRRRISRFSRSMTLLLRILRQCSRGNAMYSSVSSTESSTFLAAAVSFISRSLATTSFALARAA